MLPRTHQCTHSQVLFTLALWPCATACPTSHLSTDCFPPLASLRLVGRTCLIGVTRFLSSLQKLMGLFFSNPAFNQAQLILSLLFLMLSQIYPIAETESSFVSDSLRHHGPQHTRPPCPTPTPRVYSNSRPLSR